MPRPIVLTEEIKQKAIEDFSTILDGTKMSDGKLSYNKSFSYETGNAIVWLTQEAYRKIVALVTGFSDEVAWHGAVSRVGDAGAAGSNEFIIEDILVYPQEVTGSTVNTDQAAYTEWLYGLDDDTFNKIRMQGHSHCNMGVSPSGVDDNHRQKLLDQLEPDMFYIFMIWNRSLSVHTLIYDMAQNILYEDKDVNVKLIGDDDMDEFLVDAKKKVQKPGCKTNQPRKTRPGSKKQKAAQLGLLGAEVDLDDIEDLRLIGLNTDPEELRQLGLDIDWEEFNYYSPYDPYGLGWRRL